MIIQKYRDIPATYAPDIGEVVLARLSPSESWRHGVVLKVLRRAHGKLKVKIQWWDPATRELGDVVGILHEPDGWPPMIKQITKGQQD